MIIYKKYFTKQIDELNKKPSFKTVLEAKLRFKDDVGAAYRKDILDKIYGKIFGKNQKPGMLSEYPLNDYLDKVEKITYNPLREIYWDITSGKKRKISIKKRKFRLGLDIKITSNEILNQKEMIDLEKLNEFVLLI